MILRGRGRSAVADAPSAPARARSARGCSFGPARANSRHVTVPTQRRQPIDQHAGRHHPTGQVVEPAAAMDPRGASKHAGD